LNDRSETRLGSG